MFTAQETFDGEIIVDNFAGGGGASTGIEIATGRMVYSAICVAVDRLESEHSRSVMEYREDRT